MPSYSAKPRRTFLATYLLRRRQALKLLVKQRDLCRWVAQVKPHQASLRRAISELATEYGRYGYRRIIALLKRSGWGVNSKRVQRIWRQEGLKVPSRQPKRGRLWPNDGSCLRLIPERKDHVWAYDFVTDRTSNGKAFRMLTVVDEYIWDCLSIRVERRLNSAPVLEARSEPFLYRGPLHTFARRMSLSSVLRLLGVGSND